MKLLLFLEHRFYRIDNEIYCERIVDYKYLTRYLSVFDEVTVCARFGKKVPNKKVLASGKGISFLPLPDFVGAIGIAEKYLSCRNIVKKNIKNFDASIIRTPSPISIIAYPIVKKSILPYAAEIVINPQTMFNKDSCTSKFRPLISMLFMKHTKNICMNANGVSYVTEKVLQRLYPCRAIKCPQSEYFTTHYSSIDLDKSQCNNCFHKHIANTPYIIVHVGYMDTYSKGHLVVMNIAEKLNKNGIPIEVHFIGTGNLENEFREYARIKGISDNVIFCGNLNGYQEVQKELLIADLFLFPTVSEGLPRALIEAMANSVACVSSPIDGIIELLPKKYLVHYRNEQKMYEICRELLINDDKREYAAYECFLKSQEYTSDILNQRRSAFYTKLYKLAEERK